MTPNDRFDDRVVRPFQSFVAAGNRFFNSRIVRTLKWCVAVMVVGGFALGVIVGATGYYSGPQSAKYTPTRSPTHAKPQGAGLGAETMIWRVVGTGCADGWQSSSIGEQGACSWHGGVVTIWQNSKTGQTLSCPSGTFPPGKAEVRRQLAQSGQVYCTG